jgi:hypothetical protein
VPPKDEVPPYHHAVPVPEFVRPLPEQLSEHEVGLLMDFKATSLPNFGLLCRLLQIYVDWVHPQLPFLDLATVLETIICCNEAGDAQMSLILIQAILLASSLYAQEGDFVSSAFASKQDAQEQLFQRAKVATSRSDLPHCMTAC